MSIVFLEFLCASLISGAMLMVGMIYVIQKMIAAENHRHHLELISESHHVILTLRLQAYERLILFMERISPESLVLRLQRNASTNRGLHAEMIAAVRNEFEHNLSQQLYVKHEVWQQIVLAKNNVIRSINTLASETEPDNNSMHLAQQILNKYVKTTMPTQHAIALLKKETEQLFLHR
jgi:hypothetical protein